ncbi:MAG: iron-containing alcohol dehydrogenase [Kiritimatiellia bacterium]|nr:iron-containing alcohol dehydrogenase [Kiritimatiellia bacterium]
MLNFEYFNPTRIVFGRGTIGELNRLVPASARVLLIYGGGSIKQNGVYKQVREALGGRTVSEFPGIRPNPTWEQCMEAVSLARRERSDFLLAVGGGSTLDAAKFISVAIPYTGGDPWIFLEQRGRVMPEEALPLGTVLTLPATGSEMNPIAVISREADKEKRGFVSEKMQPLFSILDPEATFSLPPRQVRNGVVDAYIHTLEQYMTYPADAPLQDRLAESVLQTLREVGPRTLAEPTHYEARATFMWCATWALNRSLGCGVPQDWATHMIGHELTALYGVDHAESLALVLPALWTIQREKKQAKLAQYARRVFGVEIADDAQAADRAISLTVDFFQSLGMPTRPSAHGIDGKEAAAEIERRFARRGVVWGEHQDLTPARVAEVLLRSEECS